MERARSIGLAPILACTLLAGSVPAQQVLFSGLVNEPVADGQLQLLPGGGLRVVDPGTPGDGGVRILHPGLSGLDLEFEAVLASEDGILLDLETAGRPASGGIAQPVLRSRAERNGDAITLHAEFPAHPGPRTVQLLLQGEVVGTFSIPAAGPVGTVLGAAEAIAPATDLHGEWVCVGVRPNGLKEWKPVVRWTWIPDWIDLGVPPIDFQLAGVQGPVVCDEVRILGPEVLEPYLLDLSEVVLGPGLGELVLRTEASRALDHALIGLGQVTLLGGQQGEVLVGGLGLQGTSGFEFGLPPYLAPMQSAALVLGDLPSVASLPPGRELVSIGLGDQGQALSSLRVRKGPLNSAPLAFEAAFPAVLGSGLLLELSRNGNQVLAASIPPGVLFESPEFMLEIEHLAAAGGQALEVRFPGSVLLTVPGSGTLLADTARVTVLGSSAQPVQRLQQTGTIPGGFTLQDIRSVPAQPDCGQPVACAATPNSTGQVASICVQGDSHRLAVQVSGLPPGPGVLFHGAQVASLPFGNGTLCATADVVRGPVLFTAGGTVTGTLDLSPFTGQDRILQYWYRDTVQPPAFFDLSEAVLIPVP